MKKIISGIIAAATFLLSATIPPVAADAAPPSLKEESVLLMSRDGSTVFVAGGPITGEELLTEFNERPIRLETPSGGHISVASYVPSGSIVETDGGSVIVLVYGDVDKDGLVNLADVTDMLKCIAKWNVDIDKAAADLDSNDSVNLADVTTILKYLAKWDVRFGNRKIIIDETPQIAANEDAGTALWFEHSTEKLEQSDIESSGKTAYVIYAAKNEIEDANLYISPSEDKKGITSFVTPFTNCYGETVEAEILNFYYHKMDVDRPDALFPANSEMSVKAGESQGFIIKAKTTEETESGLYEATVSIKENGREIKRAKVYLNVWDFTLDDVDAPDTSFGLSKSGMAGAHILGDNVDAINDMYKLYYDYLIENRMCAVNLPYNITDERCDEYLNDDRVRSFLVGGSGYGGEYERTDDQIKAYYEKLSANEEWFEKGYFYFVDEPHFEEDFNKMDTWRAYLDKVYPGGKQLVPLDSHKVIPLPMDIYERLERSVDIYCPITHLFTPQSYRGNDDYEVFNTVEFIAKNGTYEDEIKRVTSEDPTKESWWYTAGRPVQPYANLHAEDDGTVSRILFWQQYQYDVTGYLYYLINDYEGTNPLNNMVGKENTALQPGKKLWGNGVLVYSAVRKGIKEPIWSIRVESIRDGIEDYMYMMMAERIIGEETVKEMLLEVSRNVADFDQDADKMLSVREELAEIILTAHQ